MKVGQYFELAGPLAPTDFNAKVKNYCEYLGIHQPKISPVLLEAAKVPTLLGIEVEVEGIGNAIPLPPFWLVEGDGSLRNMGKEFKSVPLSPEQALMAVAVLWKILDKTAKKADFSWRTSIHVHLNVIQMETSELKCLVLLSLLLEQFLFSFVGNEREQSPFCAPLTRSNLLDVLGDYIKGPESPKKLYSTWAGGGAQYKYSSVNFSRLGELGTVEFRHLGGTKDLAIVSLWLVLISSLYKAALSITLPELKQQILALKTSGECTKFVSNLLGKSLATEILTKSPIDIKEVLDQTIPSVKEILVVAPKFTGSAPNSAMRDYAKIVKKKYAEKKVAQPTPKKKAFKWYSESNTLKVWLDEGETKITSIGQIPHSIFQQMSKMPFYNLEYIQFEDLEANPPPEDAVFFKPASEIVSF